MHRSFQHGTSLLLIVAGLVTGLTSVVGIQHDEPYGEPYELAGRRLVFTTWYFVKPGQPDWRNKEGNSVYARDDADLGPGDATFHCQDCPTGVRLVVEPARRVGPVIRRERAWEARGISAGTLLAENGTLRLWGGCRDATGETRACHFTSTNGQSWQRPRLGLTAFAGSLDNNLIPSRIGTVFKDAGADAAEQYKTVWDGDFDPQRFADYKRQRPWSHMALETDPGRVHSIRASVSPDGFRWTELPDAISVEASDTQIVAYYDDQLQKYVMYTRSYYVGRRAQGYLLRHERWHQFTPRRAIGRSETADFRRFPLSEVIIETGNDMLPTDTFYTSCRTTIPGAPDHHVMFPAIYMQSSDTTRLELHTSYDGRLWHRVPGPPVLETATAEQWDGGCIFAHPNLVELADGSWVLPYTGYPHPHKYPRGRMQSDVGLAVWPKGRLVALEARDSGAFTTPALLAPGNTMLINAVTDEGGHILVEAADFGGRPLPGHSFADALPIEGDQYHAVVRWRSSDTLGLRAGEPVVLRFQLSKAKIYGLDFE